MSEYRFVMFLFQKISLFVNIDLSNNLKISINYGQLNYSYGIPTYRCKKSKHAKKDFFEVTFLGAFRAKNSLFMRTSNIGRYIAKCSESLTVFIVVIFINHGLEKKQLLIT